MLAAKHTRELKMMDLSRRTMLANGTALGLSLTAGAAFAQAPAAPALAAPAGGRGPGRGPAAPPSIERFDAALDALIDVNSPIEHIVSEGFQWCEGPVWVGGADGYLLASDPRANAILQWSQGGGLKTWLAPSGLQTPANPDFDREPGTNGLFLGRGGLVCSDSGTRAIVAIDLATKKRTILADRFEGKRFNSTNDLIVSPTTRQIFFTDPPYGLVNKATPEQRGQYISPQREMDYMGVFRLDPDNKVTLLGKYNLPNGIGMSPDGRTLYTTDGTLGWIAHTLDAQGNKLSERVFIDMKAENIMPRGDGLKVDAAGNLWMSGDSGLGIFNPAGHRIGRIRIGGAAPNCEFGADGYLYIANGTGLLRVKTKAQKIKIA
jgi:gluconolactonase